MRDAGWHRPRWNIDVYAVPIRWRTVVRGCLMNAGVRPVAEWLSRRRPETWGWESRHGLDIEFDPQREQVRVSREF
jgi:hypothetical protein